MLSITCALLLGASVGAAIPEEDALENLGGLLQVSLGLTKQSRNNSVLFRQVLYNAQDIQYSANITIDGQTIRGVLDTGSYEVLAFSRSCPTCGLAGRNGFDASLSGNWESGNLMKLHSYGSGSASSIDGTDTFSVGPLRVEKQDIWLAQNAAMPLLASATFSAIVGVGPPGEPQNSAQAILESDLQLARQFGNESGEGIPENVREVIENDRTILDIVNTKRDNVPYNLGVRYFSACLEWATGAPGYFIWNDIPPKEQPVPFLALDVIEGDSWSVRLTSVNLEGPEGKVSLGCEQGCEAILDTGTSLIAVPTQTYNEAKRDLSRLNADCSDMHRMPDLVFYIDGVPFTLPPQSYIGEVSGQVPGEMLGSDVNACRLLLMDAGNAP
eukprot:CAMPEP_0197907718 /NCGR_PEP_ID=MMETSP1439-20131203/65358_1 /TAXON_ID=66791 /ORGANISM="Gonyaulax spinifera, Strain CCMP409" /LENGTH=384 /DNA_ID=CAMNT_0043529169 /DNA_START=1 /DNA_END=1152 /DNA_ORIENTATION=+